MKLKSFTIILSFWFFAISSSSLLGKYNHYSFKNDSLLAIEYYNIADSYYMDISKCKRYSKLAIPLLKETKQWRKYINCYAFLSYCYDIEEAYDSLIINNEFAFKETQKYIQSNSVNYVFSLNNLAFMYSNVVHDYKKAINLYYEALEISKRTDFVFSEDDDLANIKGVLYKNLGDIYLVLGDVERAIRFFKQASFQFSNIKLLDTGDPNFRFVEAYKSLSKAYQFAGKINKAIDYNKKLLAFMDNGSIRFPLKNYVYTFTQLAELNISKKEWNKALEWLSNARSMSLNNDQEAEINRLYGLCYLNQGYYKKAHQYIDKVFDLEFTKIPIKTSRFHQLKGEIYLKEKHFQKALVEFKKALQYILPNQIETIDLKRFDHNQKVLSSLDLIKVLNKSAECYAGLENQEGLKTALNLLTNTAKISSKVQFEYQSEQSKSFLNENAYPTHERAIDIAYQLFEQTENPDFIKKGFFFFEKSKAAVLLEELNTKEAAGHSTIPKEVIDEKFRIRTDINIRKKKLEEESSKEKPKEKLIQLLNNRLFDLTREQAVLKAKIQKDYPEYSELTKGELMQIPEIQKDLDSKSAIIEYFIGEKHTYAIYISSNQIDFKKIGNTNLETQISYLKSELKLNHNIDSFCLVSNQVYDSILGVFELSKIEELVIIPDGYLSNIPFEILLSSYPKSNDLRQFDYLIKSKSIRYAYSLSLLNLQQNFNNSEGKVLVVAPVFENIKGKYLSESKNSSDAFSEIEHTSLMGDSANIKTLMKQIKDYGLIHFFTHATSKDSKTGQPAIELIDGQILLSDLYALNLPTHLAVLSACETSLGNERKGEGVMSLARGFTYAGVPSTVATLWKVNESSTSTIMQNFYKYLTQGYSKSEALRQGKLDYLKTCDDIQSTPYYWASLVSIGNDQPYHFKKKWTWEWAGIFILFAISVLFFKNAFNFLKPV